MLLTNLINSPGEKIISRKKESHQFSIGMDTYIYERLMTTANVPDNLNQLQWMCNFGAAFR